MTESDVASQAHECGRRPFCVNVEGTEHRWPRETITTEEIARLGGWDPTIGVVLIDADNNERVLKPGEVVQLRPGHAFCRRVRFRRGLTSTNRLVQELELVQQFFPRAECQGSWFRLPEYPIPSDWGQPRIDVAFRLSDGHPSAAPYGIYVPAGLRIRGKTPSNYTEPAKERPPFGGTWGMFSWQPEGWDAATERNPGYATLAWVRGFEKRFAELN